MGLDLMRRGFPFLKCLIGEDRQGASSLRDANRIICFIFMYSLQREVDFLMQHCSKTRKVVKQINAELRSMLGPQPE